MQRERRRILLICSQHLFGESLEATLRRAEDMTLLGPIEPSLEDIDAQVVELRPDAVVLVDQGEDNMSVAYLTATILQRFPSLPVIVVGLDQNTFRILSTLTIPARSSDFVEAIRNLPPSSLWDATHPSSYPES